MKLLSRTPLPFDSWDPDQPPGPYRFIANESYIAASFGGGDCNVQVVSSRTGNLVLKKPLKNRQMVGGLVLDGDNLVSTSDEPSLTVYHIPSE